LRVAEIAPSPLSPSEAADLASLEVVISNGADAFIQTVRALKEIVDRKLYRAEFRTIDAYIDARWPQISRAQAYRFVRAATVITAIESAPNPPEIVPSTVGQTGALASVPKEKIGKVWDAALETSGGKAPTPAQVRSAAAFVAVDDEEEDFAEEAAREAQEEREALQAVESMRPDEGAVVTEVQGEDAVLSPEEIRRRDEEAWLDSFEVRHRLAPNCRAGFDFDALGWKFYSESMSDLLNKLQYREGKRPKVAGVKSPLVDVYARRFAAIPSPGGAKAKSDMRPGESWKQCVDCINDSGLSTGLSGMNNCPSCYGRGYVIPGG
jgi:hypothetical protein